MFTLNLKEPLTVVGQSAVEHEQVVLCQDPESGLKAIIAIHSTSLGPAVGGTRFQCYASDEEAVADALNLSRGMSYKNAIAGLPFGGGKAVVIGDPARAKTNELLLAHGRFVSSLGGRYLTGCDVGTCPSDMDIVARTCPWTLSRSARNGGGGDTSILTARGVFQGMRAAASFRWGTPALNTRTVGVTGVGKVGRRLVKHLVAAGARVIVTDIDQEAVRRLQAEIPGVEAVDDAEALVGFGDLDIYAPCALGGALDETVAAKLTAEVVCGAANNQLARPSVEQQLAQRGILYVPDYVVNVGGVIQATSGPQGLTPRQLELKAERIFESTLDVLERAAHDAVLPGTAADRIARERLATPPGTRPRRAAGRAG
ncbi:Leu/Phe/Val dehydrogenase [Streptomyces sp. NPDC057798]|uniref:Leu/Phe/Val dehydrogenase n=1 Tax=Streptomyces sp. NPDC057798 TaxID=3346252 RepID=UPI003675EFD5